MATSADEKEPLLGSSRENSASLRLSRTSLSASHESRSSTTIDVVRLKRHITLPYAIAIIVGNVIGSGIFVSPKGVTQNIGSVGGSLIIWAVTGLYNLAQALCYAELGTVIPKSGGDYAFIYYILGPFPAFLCGWIHVAIIASSSCAVISRTGALYLIQPLGLECQISLITLMAIFFIVTLATINAISAKWGIRIHTFFTVSKLLALSIIIIVGLVNLAQGSTSSFQDSFQGTSQDPGLVALAVLDGYFAYKGWELVMALPEEMVNPKRDLPRAVWVAMLLVTAVYVLTNVAYFSVLTPAELLESDAVALTFADRAMGWAKWIIPIAVWLSCMGTVNGDFLSNSRYLFAAGRYNQIPKMFAMIHVKFYTPMLAVAMLCILAILYTAVTDLQVLQEYASLTVQVKMLLALTALFYLRWKKPNVERPVKVNTVVAAGTMIIMVALVVLSFYKAPVTTSIGVGLFLVGIPLYFLGQCCIRRGTADTVMATITLAIQRTLLVAPETEIPEEEEFLISNKHN